MTTVECGQGVAVEQAMGADTRAETNKPRFRLSVWPEDPAPRVGEPVTEYLTRKSLKARGWSLDQIREHLGASDGTREVSSAYHGSWFDSYTRTRNYYRLDRVIAAERAGEVRAGLALNQPRPASTSDARPLALTRRQLRRRGWSAALLAEFLPAPDGYHPGAWSNRPVPLYAAARVEHTEATPEFRALWALVERRRGAAAKARQARSDAWSAKHAVAEGFAAHRAAVKKARLEAAFPGFVVTVNPSRSGSGAHVGIALEGGPFTSAYARGPEVHALAVQGEKSGAWEPLVDWLAAHGEVGNVRFRRAFRFLVAGDSTGWRAWHARWESGAEERRAAGVKYGRRCKERLLEVARSIASLPENERFAAWRSRTGRGRMAMDRRLAELAAGEPEGAQRV